MNTTSQIEIKPKSESQKSYGELLKRPEWFRKRDEILTRDNHTCINCGSTNILQVHHKQYHTFQETGNFKKPWEYKEKYLITLCSKCHFIGHKKFKVPVFNI